MSRTAAPIFWRNLFYISQYCCVWNRVRMPLGMAGVGMNFSLQPATRASDLTLRLSISRGPGPGGSCSYRIDFPVGGALAPNPASALPLQWHEGRSESHSYDLEPRSSMVPRSRRKPLRCGDGTCFWEAGPAEKERPSSSGRGRVPNLLAFRSAAILKVCTCGS